jgi:hypothetical protein
MSDSSLDFGHVKQRLQEIFGNPMRGESQPCRWMLRPPRSYSPSVNVLLDKSLLRPEVWVFDALQPERSMERIIIKDEQSLDHAIAVIMEHLAHASGNAHTPSSPIPASSQGFLEKLFADCRNAHSRSAQKDLRECVQSALASIKTPDANPG